MTSEDTPVTPHRGNQDNTVEDVEISGTSNRKNASRKAKVTPMRGKESQEPPVTPQREESSVENVPGTSAGTRRLDRSRSKRNRMNTVKVAQRVLTAKRKSREERDTTYVNARDKLEANRNRITTPTQAEDDDEIVPLDEFTPRKREYQRKQPSVVWRHV